MRSWFNADETRVDRVHCQSRRRSKNEETRTVALSSENLQFCDALLYLLVAKDLANKNVWRRSSVKQRGQNDERGNGWQKEELKKSGRSKKNKTPRYSIDGSSISLTWYSRSDGMFINRLISEIGGWFRVVAGQVPRLRLNIKVLFQSGPSARVGHTFSRCICHPRRHICIHRRARMHVCARAHLLARPIDRAFFH